MAIFYKGDNFYNFPFALLHTIKGGFSEKKEYAPMESKFFPFRENPFSEGSKHNFNRVTSPEISMNILSYIIILIDWQTFPMQNFQKQSK